MHCCAEASLFFSRLITPCFESYTSNIRDSQLNSTFSLKSLHLFQINCGPFCNLCVPSYVTLLLYSLVECTLDKKPTSTSVIPRSLSAIDLNGTELAVWSWLSVVWIIGGNELRDLTGYLLVNPQPFSSLCSSAFCRSSFARLVLTPNPTSPRPALSKDLCRLPVP